MDGIFFCEELQLRFSQILVYIIIEYTVASSALPHLTPPAPH